MLCASLVLLAALQLGAEDLADPSRLPKPPANSPGFPSRSAELDALPGFQTPPPGYGEVPYWWWTGDKLDVARMTEQIEQLAAKGISGVQVNYAHGDVAPWLTYPADPPIFSDAWWQAWRQVAEVCAKHNMGIGISGYTIDWPNQPGNLFGQLLYKDAETWGCELGQPTRVDVAAGQTLSRDLPAEGIGVWAYRTGPGGLTRATDLATAVKDGKLTWTAPAEGPWQVWIYTAAKRPNTYNPIHPESGRRVIDRFFAPFEQHNGGKSAGLNFFFQDELIFGVGDHQWTTDLPAEFARRKGYPLFEALPGLWGALGDRNPKARMDYADVRTALAEERYFKPIFDWHWQRGMIYACDPGSRGRNPGEFGDYMRANRWYTGDYMRANRWYTAPGHDTPGGSGDPIKGKVSSSIAHLYQRPRVWLEGYHSLGWQANPATLMHATRENFLYGCTLLNLHGLYYSTYGSFWEWAPPCYHFRMPYWEHMRTFLSYFDRLSYLLSQGVHRCDVAMVYPVAAHEAEMDAGGATNTAFDTGEKLIRAGIDFDFVDHQSLERAVVRDGRLEVSGESYSCLLLPAMRAVRWSTIQKALELQRAGGTVIAIGALPEASDRAGANDPELKAALAELFGKPGEVKQDKGRGLFAAPTAVGSRRYEGGFEGRFAWTTETNHDAWFKGVYHGPAGKARVRFLCDNAGKLFRDGKQLCEGANYSQGWTGEVDLRDGAVLTIDAYDEDGAPNKAGMYLALVRDGKTFFSTADLKCTATRPAGDAWRTDAALDGWHNVDFANVHEAHLGTANTPIEQVMKLLPRDWRGEKTVRGLHRRVGPRDVYFLMDAAPSSEITFSVQGRPELWDPWTGDTSPLTVTAADAQGTKVQLPAEIEDAVVVTFSPGQPAVTAAQPPPAARQAVEVAGDWGFELRPTLDNKWGDFRLPVVDKTLGAEARIFRYAEETAADPGWQAPGFDDSRWPSVTHGFGQQLWVLGPVPNTAELDGVLTGLRAVKAGDTVKLPDRQLAWKPYDFSWRLGREGDPGHQGYHGLKENVSDEFLCLGKPQGGLNETLYVPEDGGGRYYLWSSVTVPQATAATLVSGGLKVAAAWLAGQPVTDQLSLSAGANPLLLRIEQAGRGHVVVRRAGPEPTARTPLSMCWYDDPRVIPFDPRPAETAPAGWYRFVAPPGLKGFRASVRGQMQAWADGQPLRVEQRDGHQWVKLGQPAGGRVVVALRIAQERGRYGGAALPEPIALDCGPGTTPLGDWSQGSVLETYSGGAVYRHNLTLTAAQAAGAPRLDLGDVVATAEVRINGQSAGVRVAPPWRFDLSGKAKAGDNQIEVIVYSTLANHYRTIPTRYRGSLKAGLVGPVRLEWR
ncbi:MAG: hypothetical protein HZB16_09870 [Armatimonadetes bacterium]|nr:hypothetical protein [Armatimonadota bacterium]